jgi:hypothetical protein
VSPGLSGDIILQGPTGFLRSMDSNRESLLDCLGCSRSPRLSGSLCFHALDLDNLPIIVSYPITSLMFFVHLHIVW